jgi:hypothetical protein
MDDFIIENQLEDVPDWDEFLKYLNHILDVWSTNEATIYVNEFVGLQNYLNSEYDLSCQENGLYFSNPDQIVEYLNSKLKIKLFRLSQSINLFDENKRGILPLLKKYLTGSNLNETMNKFNKIENNFFELVESTKSR